MDYIYHDRLMWALERALENLSSDGPIGTQSESVLHSTMKNFLEPDSDYHEVFIEGYYADICRGSNITEIQTKSFGRLRDKLKNFLKSYKVTICYPLINTRWIEYVDFNEYKKSALSVIKDSGRAKRKSPLHLGLYDVFTELYGIKDYLNDNNLKICIYEMDIDELKAEIPIKRRGRRNVRRINKIPIGIRNVYEIERTEDYMQFIPIGVKNGFTSADFAREANISRSKASLVLNVLKDLNSVKRVAKKGNAYIYDISREC